MWSVGSNPPYALQCVLIYAVRELQASAAVRNATRRRAARSGQLAEYPLLGSVARAATTASVTAAAPFDRRETIYDSQVLETISSVCDGAGTAHLRTQTRSGLAGFPVTWNHQYFWILQKFSKSGPFTSQRRTRLWLSRSCTNLHPFRSSRNQNLSAFYV